MPEHLEGPVLPAPKTSLAMLNSGNDTARTVEMRKVSKALYKPAAHHPWRRMTIGKATTFPFAKIRNRSRGPEKLYGLGKSIPYVV